MPKAKKKSIPLAKAFIVALIGVMLFGAVSQALAQDFDVASAQRPNAIVRVYGWSRAKGAAVINWVREQGTKIARAFFGAEELLVALNPEPQVAGDTALSEEEPLDISPPAPAVIPVQQTTPAPVVTKPEPAPTVPKSVPEIVEPTPELTPAPEPEAVPVAPELAPLPTPTPTPEVPVDSVVPFEPAPAPETSAPIAEGPGPDNANQLYGWSTPVVLAPDIVAPTSEVAALSAVTTDFAFTVSWSGEDNTRDGVASFDIQYQVDDEEWQEWLLETVLMSSVFTANVDGAYGFRSRGRDFEGNTEEYPDSADASTEVNTTPDYSVVINEIAWVGTAAADTDEWIELYNTTASDIDLANWTLASSDGSFSITLAGAISAKGYFLLETREDAVSTITADQIYTQTLPDTSLLLYLRKADTSFADKAGQVGAWFAGDSGTDVTMERKDPTSDGMVAGNWANNDANFTEGKDAFGALLKATPRSLNSQNTTIPRHVTNLQPQHIYTTTDSIRLYWTTPKKANLLTSQIASYELRYSTATITEDNFASVFLVSGVITPSASIGDVATSTVSGLSPSTTYYFALKTFNGNETSTISNIASVSTISGALANFNSGFASDQVSSDTVRTRAGGPYEITRGFTINVGKTLTIEPGTVVKVRNTGSNCTPCNITVNGNLVIGSSADTVNGVVITSLKDDTYAGDTNNNGLSNGSMGEWGKIIAGNGSVLTLDNAIIRYGGLNSGTGMIQLSGATAEINNSIIEYGQNDGIHVVTASALTVSDSSIQNNRHEGLEIAAVSTVSVSGTTFTGNRRGVFISVPSTGITLNANNFFGNNRAEGLPSNAGVHFTDTTTTLTVSDSWWGDASGPIENSPTVGTRDGAIDDEIGALEFILIPSFRSSPFTIKPSGL